MNCVSPGIVATAEVIERFTERARRAGQPTDRHSVERLILETAMAKTAANLAAKFVCDEAIQLLGGYGFSREYPVERAYRDIRGLCIGAGTVEIQRNFIGSQLLRSLLDRGHDAVGWDAFTDYYDPELKERNAEGLQIGRAHV